MKVCSLEGYINLQISSDMTSGLIVATDLSRPLYGKIPPMFIKLKVKWFGARLTDQERGAGLGDIFTQNTLSAIKFVCQVVDLGLCGRTGRRRARQMGGSASRRDHSISESSAAGYTHT